MQEDGNNNHPAQWKNNSQRFMVEHKPDNHHDSQSNFSGTDSDLDVDTVVLGNLLDWGSLMQFRAAENQGSINLPLTISLFYCSIRHSREFTCL